jgi:homoserine kinase
MSTRPPDFELALPATSANLGPAFDAAALALRMHLRVRASAAGTFSIEARGRDVDICSQLEHNLLLATYREVLQQHRIEPLPLELHIDNEFPIGKGMGSSAAARLAGIALADHFGQLGRNDDQVLEEAVRRERHGDNVAACWLGGFAVVRWAGTEGPRQPFRAHKLDVCGEWPLLIAIPDKALATERARSVLPDRYPRSDAVANVQSAMLLAAAFLSGRAALVADALQDRIHEPYRSSLCPLLDPLRSLAGREGVLGAALSGAGPSVLVVLDSAVDPAGSRDRVAAFLDERGLRAELLLTSIETRGARDQRRKGAGVLAGN